MTNGNGNNSFSWGDALFLHIERPGQPLNIAGVSMFEGEIKLADLPRFRRIEASADSPLSSARGAYSFRSSAFPVGSSTRNSTFATTFER